MGSSCIPAVLPSEGSDDWLGIVVLFDACTGEEEAFGLSVVTEDVVTNVELLAGIGVPEELCSAEFVGVTVDRNVVLSFEVVSLFEDSVGDTDADASEDLAILGVLDVLLELGADSDDEDLGTV